MGKMGSNTKKLPRLAGAGLWQTNAEWAVAPLKKQSRPRSAQSVAEVRRLQHELEARYHDLYENAPDMYLSVDSATGRVIQCNQTFLNATGYAGDEIVGRPVFELYQPESRPVARAALKRFVATGSLQNLELILKRKDGSALPISLNSTAVRDKQGRILHSRSILRDIGDRKRIEAELRHSEERFRAITDFSPDIISIFDREGRLVFNSAAAEKIHGYKDGELENRSTFDLIHPDDRPGVNKAFGNLLKVPRKTVNVQYRYRNADGSYKWMEAIARNELANPQINGVIAISRDITGRKQNEDELRKSAWLIAETGKLGKVGGWEFDITSGKQTWTEAVYEIHEVDTSYEPTVEKGIKFYTPASRPVIERAVKMAIARGQPFDLELEIVTAKGNRRFVKAIGRVDLEHQKIFGFFQDITERKQAELALSQLNEMLEQRVIERTAALQASEERFRGIASNTPDHILIQDRNLRYQLVINPQLGLTEADMIGKTDRDLFKKADATRLVAIKRQVLKTGKPFHVETPFPNLKGEIEYFEGDYIPRRDVQGRVDGLIGYFRNVTKRKLVEQKSEESEAKFFAAFKNSPAAMNISRIDNGLVVDANDAFFKATGYTREETINSTINKLKIWVDQKMRAQTVKQLIDQGIVQDLEFKFRRKDGRIGIGIFSAHLIHLKNATHIISAVNDITERKGAEDKLAEKEFFLRNIYEHVDAAIAVVKINAAGEFAYGGWNPVGEMITGIKSDQAMGRSPKQVFGPVVGKRIVANYGRCVREGTQVYEEYFATKQGAKWSETTLVPIQNEAGRVVQIACFAIDITKRKQAEIALQQREEHYRMLFTHSRDALLISEAPSWKFTAANPAAVEMFRAMNVQQLLSTVPWELSPAFQPNGLTSRQAATIVINKAMKEGSHSFEWRHQRLNGEEFPAVVLLARIKIEGRTVLQGTVRDITEQVRLEQEVLTISDHERRRIAQDLHDGLGQILAGASFLTHTAFRNLTKSSPKAAKPLERIQEVIDEAISQARNLAHDIQPVEPEPNGLQASLEKLAAQTREIFHIRCDFGCRQPILIESEKVATNLFRIAQEAVTNALKHGKPKHIRISLVKKNKRIHLAVADNGLGISSGSVKKTGMGLRIMNYRARLIDGVIRFRKNPGGGTIVECSLLLYIGGSKHGKTGKKN